MIGTTRLFLAVQAGAFLIASLVHRGLIFSGYEHREAAIAETVIGLVLLAGLAASLFLPHRTRALGIAVQAFALLGTCVGLFTIAVGIGPQTAADLVLHAGLILLLVAGLALLVRWQGVDT